MIAIVSGLPRSGTSLLMQMLAAGGAEILTDERRAPDTHNPRGYFEYDPVRRLERDQSWLEQAQGKVVKVVSLLLYHLPAGFEYQVLFVNRDLDEVLRSQEKMLADRGTAGAGPDRQAMRRHFERHLAALTEWLPQQPHFRKLDCQFAEVIAQPTVAAQRFTEFLGWDLDPAAMAAAVDPALYRQRSSSGSREG